MAAARARLGEVPGLSVLDTVEATKLVVGLAGVGADGVTVGLAVLRVRALELAEGGGVQVEPLHAHPHLVGPELRPGVELLGGLREDTGRGHDAVQTDG